MNTWTGQHWTNKQLEIATQGAPKPRNTTHRAHRHREKEKVWERRERRRQRGKKTKEGGRTRAVMVRRRWCGMGAGPRPLQRWLGCETRGARGYELNQAVIGLDTGHNKGLLIVLFLLQTAHTPPLLCTQGEKGRIRHTLLAVLLLDLPHPLHTLPCPAAYLSQCLLRPPPPTSPIVFLF